MDKSKLVITIERQYGSGGRITGMRLAEELGIHYYDEEILKIEQLDHDKCLELFDEYKEKQKQIY